MQPVLHRSSTFPAENCHILQTDAIIHDHVRCLIPKDNFLGGMQAIHDICGDRNSAY